MNHLALAGQAGSVARFQGREVSMEATLEDGLLLFVFRQSPTI